MGGAVVNPLRHTMILASAGSGKTYALTNRFIALLAVGAAPERIVALTFTRKAAGEFFDEILRKLARAAASADEARVLAGQIERPELGPRDFLRLLRATIDAMHRLRLGTLDSFFARIARAFPLELGLAGEFEILQEHAARLERQRVLRRMFARNGRSLDAAQSEFIEAFKRATFGVEEKQLGARLDGFLDSHQENFLAAPDAAMWGDPGRIWPSGSEWLEAQDKLADAVQELRRHLNALNDGQKARWENFFSALETWTPGAVLAPSIEYILKNALAVWRDVCEGRAEMVVDRRKLTLNAAACRALRQVITHLIGAELRRRLERTRGIFAVLRGYESVYHDSVRRAGRLTFADVQRLLAPVTLESGTSRARVEDALAAPPGSDSAQLDLSAALSPESASERRLLLDYRLDAEIDHWLLDEFQDTSFGQWSILRNLIDEVIQDAEGRRTFFCVGDVKQAIYAWREGDPRLFREIFDHYNAAAPDGITERHLVESWRSGPPLIEMVNAVFGDANTLAELFPGPASTTWNREWRAHRSAVPERGGQAALLLADDEAGRWALVRQLIGEIQPLDRGLSCAVLVQRNDTAAAIADYLRHAGVAAVAEADLHIATDNPVGAALLALVQAAAHPGDSLAQEQVRMTPLGSVLADCGIDTPEALTRRVLGQVHQQGFERMAEHWIAQLEAKLDPHDAFSRLRARQITAAAGLFDATGSREAGEFIGFMERYAIRPPESAAAVRVMTIHKAKGLGFEVVIMPDLEGTRIDQRREGLAVQKARDRSVQWILDLPPKLFCAQDEILAAHVRSAEADACYENLSLLYVALTRAKRGLYVITEPVGDSKSRNFPRLLADTLGAETRDIAVGGKTFAGSWASGDPRWYEAISRPPAAGETAALECLDTRSLAARPRYVARRPSVGPAESVPAATLFALETSAAASFGTTLHAMFAAIEWGGVDEIEKWTRVWRTEGLPASAIAAVRSCLEAPALAHVWQRPSGRGSADVWRECPFEIVLEHAWITGVFDRVVVARSSDRRAVSATVFDFKTDRVAGPADVARVVARYRDQLETYRRAAAVLAGLEPSRVGAELVLTQLQRAVPVPRS